MEYNYYPQNTTELIDVIETANNRSNDENKIFLKSNQLYLLTTVEDTTDGHGDSALPRITANIHIVGNGAILKLAVTAPDCRILHIGPNATDVRIDGVKFLNGRLTMALSHGGAIKNEGKLTLRNTIFEGNHAGESTGGYGGAILNQGLLTVESSNLENNEADSEGGAIYNDSNNSLTLKNVIIRNNKATYGGAVYSLGDVTAKNCRFESNRVGLQGGALFIGGGTNSIKNSTLTGNWAGSHGGAVTVENRSGFGSVVFDACRIYGNYGNYSVLGENYDFNNLAPITVYARNTYWGTEDGPSGAPDDIDPEDIGSGDSVSPGVEVLEFETSDVITHDSGVGGKFSCNSDTYGNPIGLREGEKRLIETDLSVETPSGPLAFTRYYRQGKQFDPQFQFMGLGWTHNHIFHLDISGTAPDRKAAIGTPSGGMLYLAETSIDFFEADAGAYASMEVVSGEYLLTMQDETVYTFIYNSTTSRFEMTSCHMSNNQIWTYAYDAASFLTSVTDEYGRGLQFAYDMGYLVRVGDHNANLTPGSLSGRYVEFEYQNAKAKSTSEGDILATDKLLHKVYDVYQAAKATVDKDPWTYVYYGQDAGETDTAQFNWLIKRISPTPEVDAEPITLEKLQYLNNQSAVIAQQFDATLTSTTFNLVPGHAYTIEAQVTVTSGSVTMSVTHTEDFDVNSSSTGSQTLSKTISSWGGSAVTRNHQVVIDGNATVQSITVTETDPDFHTIIQQRGIEGTVDPLQSTTFVVKPNGRNETQEIRSGYEAKHLFDRGLLVGKAVTLSTDETLIETQYINDIFRPDFNEDANGHMTHLQWSADGRRLDAVTDALDQTITFTYDAQERLIQSIDAQNTMTAYTYDDINVPRQPTSIQVNDDETILSERVFTYDSKGRTLSEVTYGEGGAATGPLVQSFEREYYDYATEQTPEAQRGDGLLKLLRVFDADSGLQDRTTSYTYDDYGRLIGTSNSSLMGTCQSTSTSYDEAGRVISTSCSSSGTTNYAYDSLGRRIETTYDVLSSISRTTRTIFDALGRVVRTIENYFPQGSSAPGDWVFEGGIWKTETGPSGVEIEHGDENTQNIISDIAYNARGFVKSHQDVLGTVTLYGYDDANRLVKTIQSASDPGYNVEADPGLSGYTTILPDPDKDVITTSDYDAGGNVIRTIDASGSVTLFGYDALNRQVKLVRHASNPDYLVNNPDDPTLSAYTPAGGSFTQPDRDFITETSYDSLGRVVETKQLMGHVSATPGNEIWDVSRMVYDALGRQRLSIAHFEPVALPTGTDTDPNTWVWDEDNSRWEDAIGNPVHQAGETAYNSLLETIYDPEGRVQSTRDIEGKLTHSVYDGLNRQIMNIHNYVPQGTPESDPADWSWSDTHEQWEYATDLAISHGSNNDENIINFTYYDADGKVRFTRDNRGNVTNQVYSSDRGQLLQQIVNYTHDPLSQGIYDWGASEWYLYSPYGSGPAPDHGPENDVNIISRMEYDTIHRHNGTRNVNGQLTRTSYDELGRHRFTVSNFTHPVKTTKLYWVYEDGVWKDERSAPIGGERIIEHGANQDENLPNETSYDIAGRVESTRDPSGVLTRYHYDAMDRRTEVVWADGTAEEMRTYTCFDKAGRVLRSISNYIPQVTAPENWVFDGNVWKTGEGGDLIEHGLQNDTNLVTEYVYDQAGRRVQVIDPVRNVIETAYFKSGQQASITQKDVTVDGALADVVTIYRYDGAQRRTKVVQNYKAQGNPVVDPSDWTWSETNEEWEYATGQIVASGSKADENIIVEVEYDRLGRKVSQRDPRGNETTYGYDKLGRRRTLTNPLAKVWETTYEDNGYATRIRMDYPGLSDGTYSVERDFDRLGRLQSISYGDLARTPDVRFAYDPLGNRLSMEEFTGSGFTNKVRETSFAYDGVNRLNSVVFDRDADGTPENVVSYDYDVRGLRTSLQAGVAYDVQYAYNPRRQLEALTILNQGMTAPATTFAYDGVGRLVSTQRDDQFTSNYSYDLAGHLQQLHHTLGSHTLARFDYTTDALGNRTQATEWLPDVTTTSSVIEGSDPTITEVQGTWSDVNGLRVSSTSGDILQVAFSDDLVLLEYGVGPDHGIFNLNVDGVFYREIDGYAAKAGTAKLTIPLTSGGSHTVSMEITGTQNASSTGTMVRFSSLSLLSMALNQQTIDYTYDGLSRLVEADYDNGTNVYAYGYDAAGNLVNKNGVTRIYDAANRMTNDGTNTLTYDDNGNLTSDGVNNYGWDRANRMISAPGNTSYGYDGLGNRVQQTIDATVTHYLNDIQPGLTQLIAASTGGDTEVFVHGPRGIHAQKIAQADTAVWSQAIWGQATWGLDWQYLLQDGLGSVRVETDTEALVLTSGWYDPYGVPNSSSGNFELLFGFTGEQTDTNGQIYLRARYYEPDMGIFTALDPWEGIQDRPMSLNGYLYVEGNPINSVDPDGNMVANISLTDINSVVPPSPVPVDPTELIRQLMCGLKSSDDITFPKELNKNWPIWIILLILAALVGVIGQNRTRNRNNKGEIGVFRGLDAKKNGAPATNPGQFRIDPDGLSTFELNFLPPIKPFALPYLVVDVSVPPSQGDCGTVQLVDLTCQGCYTPQYGEGHWSISCPVPDEIAKQSHKAYADVTAQAGLIIPNPNFVTGS